MIRILLTCFSGILLAAAIFTSWENSENLTPAELKLARGGDPSYNTKNVFCDEESGVYSGCAAAGGSCAQCGNHTSPFTPSKVIVVDYTRPVNGGQQEGQEAQDCGTIWMGSCVTDATSPSGFRCDLDNTQNVCTIGIFSAVSQQGGIGPGTGN